MSTIELPPYPIGLPWYWRVAFDFAALVARARFGRDPGASWYTPFPDAVTYRDFLRTQAFYFSPRYFHNVVPCVAPSLRSLLAEGRPLLYAVIHHGFFPAIPFAIRYVLGRVCGGVATGVTRNLNPKRNPEHLYWKYTFFYQARRLLGQRMIFSDEPPQLALRWLRHANLGVAIDVQEVGHDRRSTEVCVAGTTLWLPQTVTRLARLSGVPIVPTSLYRDAAGNVILALGEPHRVRHRADEAPVFQSLCDALFEPYFSHPEQQFFDIIATFGARPRLTSPVQADAARTAVLPSAEGSNTPLGSMLTNTSDPKQILHEVC
ncbi:MAG: hypothetical protein N3A55_07850 [Methylohalobius sp.]|nr:hypothetical protein [Methylohalobius sp.]